MLGKRAGLVANARNAWPSHDVLSQLEDSWLRTIVYNYDELDSALQNTPSSIHIIALLNEETDAAGSDLANWDDALAQFATRFAGRVAAVECLNEWDLHNTDPKQAADLAIRASQVLAPVGIKTLIGSVAGSDWINQLQLATTALPTNHQISGACFHPYGKSANGFPANYTSGELRAAIDAASLQSHLPIYVTEFGAPLNDVGGIWGQANYVMNCLKEMSLIPTWRLAAACYFAWTDSLGTANEQGDHAFGLIDADGNPRPAWHSFQFWRANNL